MPGPSTDESKMDPALQALQEENDRLRKRLNFIEQIINEKCGYAEDLVVYARSQNEARNQEIARDNPEEVSKLKADPDWQHGFNSASLAICRLISEIIGAEHIVAEINDDNMDDADFEPLTPEEFMQQAADDYPSLDI